MGNNYFSCTIMKTIILILILVLMPNTAIKMQKRALKLNKIELSQDTTYNYCIKIIKRYEVFRLKKYELFGDHYVGYGHMVDSTYNYSISEAQADSILKIDFKLALKRVNSLGLKLPKNKRLTLACFVFNCGIGRLQRSDLLKMIIAKEPGSLIKKQYSGYCWANGKYIPSLVDRRRDEFLIW